MAKREMIPDEFGKKIGGSKRDLWAARGLIVSDMDDMNDAEREKYAQKKYIWPTPDYKKLCAEGRDRLVLFFIKKIKDAIATRPLAGTLEGYVAEVNALKEKLMSLQTWEECTQFLTWLKETGRLKASYSALWQNSERAEAFANAGGRKIYRATYCSKESLMREIKRTEFCYSDEEKEKAAYDAFRHHVIQTARKEVAELTEEFGKPWLKTPGMGMAVKGLDRETFDKVPATHTMVFLGRSYVTSCGPDDVETTIRALYETSKAVSGGKKEEKKKGKTRFIPAPLLQCRRETNGVDTSIQSGISPEDILSAFHFRGGEFGNWLNDDTRRKNLSYAYAAFRDLSTAIGFREEDIALNGRLNIAFGARGNGNAAAHYEPLREVINLTKFSGAGALAHEYGHALDDILSKEEGNRGAYTEAKGRCREMDELLNVMKYKEQEVTITAESLDTREKDEKAMRYYLRSEFRHSNDSMAAAEEWMKENVLDMTVEKLGQMADAHKMDLDTFVFHYAFGHDGLGGYDRLTELKKLTVPGAKNLKKDFLNGFHYNAYSYLKCVIRPAETKQVQKVKTDFYKGSELFDAMHSKEDKGYWASDVEMFARAFSCYVKDKLEEMGMVNDYLCGHSDSFVSMDLATGETIRAFPVGDERKAINRAIDRLLDGIQSRGILKTSPVEEKEETKDTEEYLPWGELTKFLIA